MRSVTHQLNKLIRHGDVFKGKRPDYILLSDDYRDALIEELTGSKPRRGAVLDIRYQNIPVHLNPHAGVCFMQIGWGTPFLKEIP